MSFHPNDKVNLEAIARLKSDETPDPKVLAAAIRELYKIVKEHENHFDALSHG